MRIAGAEYRGMAMLPYPARKDPRSCPTRAVAPHAPARPRRPKASHALDASGARDVMRRELHPSARVMSQERRPRHAHMIPPDSDRPYPMINDITGS